MKHRYPPRSFEESIYTTLAFFNVFDFPPTLEEIMYYSMRLKHGEDDVRDFLKSDALIGEQYGYYFIFGRQNIVDIRKERTEINDGLWLKVIKYVPCLQMVPFIKVAAVCNNLAFNNCKTNSDIDLFIITKKERLFTARTLSTILFMLMGIKRNKKKIAGRFCLSFYISEDGMNLKKMALEPFDVYLDYWFRSLKPVYFDKTILRKFFRENEWSTDRFYQWGIKEPYIKDNRFFKLIAKVQEIILNRGFGNFMEKILEKVHMHRFEKNKKYFTEESDVVVTNEMLKFHNIDKRKEFRKKFLESYKVFK
jgi:hypothetical protein